MDVIPTNSFILPSLISLLLIWFITKFHLKPTKIKNPPPSPPHLPIIGNLHQLGSLPHYNLQTLAKKHGPLMLLHFGSAPVLIASSAETARDILKTHDIDFSDRTIFKAHKKCLYNAKGLAFASYGDHWRQVKSSFVLKLLNNKRVQSFRSINEEETALLVKKIGESSGALNLSNMFAKFSNDGISRVAFGRKFGGSENGKKFLVLVKELSEVVAAIDIGAYIPWLSWISRFNGYDEKIERVAKGVDDFLEGVIEERLKIMKDHKNDENFGDIMLQAYNEKSAEDSIDRDSIKAIILDAFAAGTDTTSVLMEWMMAELLRHPSKMERLQNEVREIAKHDIRDEDLEKMHYLKAVIKETLRYHPPFPLLIPRRSRADVKINGYDISAKTIVMVNAWAIARDPEYWDEAEKFKPERFLNSSVDFKGFDFQYIPFGAGRRGCPGISFSVANMEYLLANLVQKFNWKLPNGAEGKDLDMSEKQGIINTLSFLDFRAMVNTLRFLDFNLVLLLEFKCL